MSTSALTLDPKRLAEAFIVLIALSPLQPSRSFQYTLPSNLSSDPNRHTKSKAIHHRTSRGHRATVARLRSHNKATSRCSRFRCTSQRRTHRHIQSMTRFLTQTRANSFRRRRSKCCLLSDDAVVPTNSDSISATFDETRAFRRFSLACRVRGAAIVCTRVSCWQDWIRVV